MEKEHINVEKMAEEMLDLLYARDLLEELWEELEDKPRSLSKGLREKLTEYFEFHDEGKDE